jgi:hypothetical protein
VATSSLCTCSCYDLSCRAVRGEAASSVVIGGRKNGGWIEGKGVWLMRVWGRDVRLGGGKVGGQGRTWMYERAVLS